jgi:hypothetical protein
MICDDCVTSATSIFSDEVEYHVGLITGFRVPPVTSTKEGTMSADLRDSVALKIGSVPEVQAVFATLDNKTLHVWSVVPEHDSRVYRSIYAKEKEIIRQFGWIDFDFNVVPSRGKDPREMLSQTAEIAFLR